MCCKADALANRHGAACCSRSPSSMTGQATCQIPWTSMATARGRPVQLSRSTALSAGWAHSKPAITTTTTVQPARDTGSNTSSGSQNSQGEQVRPSGWAAIRWEWASRSANTKPTVSGPFNNLDNHIWQATVQWRPLDSTQYSCRTEALIRSTVKYSSLGSVVEMEHITRSKTTAVSRAWGCATA